MKEKEVDKLSRWKLILGSESDTDKSITLTPQEKRIDKALGGVYGTYRKGGLKKSYPRVSDWLEDIRNYFPKEVVSVIQLDAIDRLGLLELLAEEEVADLIEPDIELVTTILALRDSLPPNVKETARKVIRKNVDRIKELLQPQLEKAYTGFLSHQSTRKNDAQSDLDWRKTIFRNLKNYQPETGQLHAEKIYTFRRNRHQRHQITVLVDSSASMSNSIVYASIYACVLASLPSLKTQLILFDSEIADVSDFLEDPTDLLFGLELGGGTNIGKALAYAKQIIDIPDRTTLFLISDLEEGYRPERVPKEFEYHKNRGTKCICLTALTDEGNPSYDRKMAVALSAMDIPVFGCTPNLFPQLLVKALEGAELNTSEGLYVE
nr:VWA domain-containing protein [Saprospiraceae bacterium]